MTNQPPTKPRDLSYFVKQPDTIDRICPLSKEELDVLLAEFKVKIAHGKTGFKIQRCDVSYDFVDGIVIRGLYSTHSYRAWGEVLLDCPCVGKGMELYSS